MSFFVCLINCVDCEVLYSSNYYNGLSYCVLDRSGGVKDTAADDIQTLVVFDITCSDVQTAVIISSEFPQLRWEMAVTEVLAASDISTAINACKGSV